MWRVGVKEEVAEAEVPLLAEVYGAFESTASDFGEAEAILEVVRLIAGLFPQWTTQARFARGEV